MVIQLRKRAKLRGGKYECSFHCGTFKVPANFARGNERGDRFQEVERINYARRLQIYSRGFSALPEIFGRSGSCLYPELGIERGFGIKTNLVHDLEDG